MRAGPDLGREFQGKVTKLASSGNRRQGARKETALVIGNLVSIADVGPMVHATLRLPDCPPDRALTAFTDPMTLAPWWGGELTTDLSVGGPYTVQFVRLGRTMTGEVLGYEPASRLEFTWAWDSEPEDDRRTVLITVAAGTGFDGTELTVVHGPHAESEAEMAARNGHHEGWEHFLPRLAAVLSQRAK
jgi:uncharacterized protein YndB with AHSA1/START domain